MYSDISIRLQLTTKWGGGISGKPNLKVTMGRLHAGLWHHFSGNSLIMLPHRVVCVWGGGAWLDIPLAYTCNIANSPYKLNQYF